MMKTKKAESATQTFQNGSEMPFIAAPDSILGMIPRKIPNMTCSLKDRRKPWKILINKRPLRHFKPATWKHKFSKRSKPNGKPLEKHLWTSILKKQEKSRKKSLKTFWIFGVLPFQMKFLLKSFQSTTWTAMVKSVTKISSLVSEWRCFPQNTPFSD